MRKIVLVMLIIFHISVTTQLHAEIDVEGVEVITDSVTRMCAHPGNYGYVVEVGGEAETSKFLKFLGKLIGSIDIEVWNETNEKLEEYQSDPALCAQNILPLLLKHFVPLEYFSPSDESTDVTYQYFHAISMMIVDTPEGKQIGNDPQRRNFYFGVLRDISSHVNDIGIRNLIINELENQKFGAALLEGMCNQYRDQILQNVSAAESIGDERPTFNVVFDNARDICMANYWGQ